ncbi:MAG: aminoglycoside phosphotransferase family protein [Clostridiales bacterium]|jgi:hypothetical protein|nr:aminoglycoside phosphotransferase family protein [Clostridiales bacterium]
MSQIKYGAELERFAVRGRAASVTPYGEGHINETYLAVTDAGAKYILQKINDRLFTDVPSLMSNITAVTEHIRKKLVSEKLDPLRYTLTVIPALGNGSPFYKSAAGYFRVYHFIDNATAHQRAENESQFYQSAVAFGAFQNYLADFDASRLAETLPDFHNTVKRFSDFKTALKNDAAGRAKTVAREVDFVLSREDYCGRIVSLLKSGAMPLRVTHNDTKLNNVMLDDATGKALAVIDLDTVMPGSSCYDFGDSIRFGCSAAAEDERDLNKVVFVTELFSAYVRGYLGALKNIIDIERDNLAFSAILLTYECGMRFLADHLNGDVYFRTARSSHNLDRARTQFKLVEEMERLLPVMQKIVGRGQ